ncbi:40S ribosomal protein [Rhizophlyctis rosea]|uniref:40S ribosomal protein n=1 Tax=Rhizophlyctis rosea TaxID=64517 RepID=A0AAD5S5U2_9FUNG|nr:40S ribosomal protein [Rhizophlyctis rosea]
MPTIQELVENYTPPVAGPVQKDPEALMKEIMNTPLFMDRLPTAEDAEENETLAAIQSLVYDGNPDEIATNFKNQGNDCYKQKDYRNAIQYYNKGLQAKSDNRILNATLLCNRAAVNLDLGNYRKVLTDCAAALRLDLSNIKAFFRSTKALLALDRVDEALDCCDLGLSREPNNKALQSLRVSIVKRKQEMEEMEVKRKQKEEKRREEEEKLAETIKARGVRLVTFKRPTNDDSDTEEPSLSKPSYINQNLDPSHRVTLTPSGLLTWPVSFIYPEHSQSDLIAAFAEDSTFGDHIDFMFGEDQQRPSWDKEGVYTPGRLEVYVETTPTEVGEDVKLLRVGRDLRLAEVLALPKVAVVDGVARFYLVPRGTEFAKRFRRRYKSKSGAKGK